LNDDVEFGFAESGFDRTYDFYVLADCEFFADLEGALACHVTRGDHLVSATQFVA